MRKWHHWTFTNIGHERRAPTTFISLRRGTVPVPLFSGEYYLVRLNKFAIRGQELTITYHIPQ